MIFFVLWGCSDEVEPEGIKESVSDSNREAVVLSEEELDAYKKDSINILNLNKDLITELYDDIGCIVMCWIATDRISYKEGNSIEDLDCSSLNTIKHGFSVINTPAGKRAEDHVNFLIDKKTALLNKLPKLKSNNFREEINALIESNYYKDTLIKSDYIPKRYDIKIKKDKYIKNRSSVTSEIISKIGIAKDHFKEVKPKKFFKKNNIRLIEYIKNQGLLFLILLIASVIFNILQYIFYKKKVEKLNSELLEVTEELASIETAQEKISDDSFKSKPSQLSDHIVKNKIESAYETMHKTLLYNYHRDCVEDQEVTYNTLLSDTIAAARSERFTSEQELASYISKQIQKHRALLEIDIQECVSQDVAIQQIHTRITTEDFLPTINTAIIPESEVRAKVQLLRQNLIKELPLTTTQEVLSGIINDFKQSIETHLHKMLQENLVFYFPFADVRGALSDEKKSKTKARDSALQLSLSPDNVTQATFHLLLDQEQMMQAGIMSYDSLLLPICILKPENFNSSGTRIEEIGTQGGTMTLEDGKWRVKDKLPIKII